MTCLEQCQHARLIAHSWLLIPPYHSCSESALLVCRSCLACHEECDAIHHCCQNGSQYSSVLCEDHSQAKAHVHETKTQPYSQQSSFPVLQCIQNVDDHRPNLQQIVTTQLMRHYTQLICCHPAASHSDGCILFLCVRHFRLLTGYQQMTYHANAYGYAATKSCQNGKTWQQSKADSGVVLKRPWCEP